jgi:hypothetical protein
MQPYRRVDCTKSRHKWAERRVWDMDMGAGAATAIQEWCAQCGAGRWQIVRDGTPSRNDGWRFL